MWKLYYNDLFYKLGAVTETGFGS